MGFFTNVKSHTEVTTRRIKEKVGMTGDVNFGLEEDFSPIQLPF